MSEDQDLLAKISQLAGHINRHKTQNTRSNSSDNRSSIHPYAENSVGRGFGRGATAYGRARGRGRAPVPHRNRTLVLNTSGSQTPTTGNDENAPTAQSTTPSGGEPTASASGWVAKRDRHMQLINTSIYDKETQARVKAIEETRKLKARQRDERERSKIHKHLQRLAAQKAHGGVASKVPGATSNSVHEILIHDIPFRVANGGSKLIKLSDSSSARATPKKATVGGVVFVRSKNGNLYRSGIVKAKRAGQKRKQRRSSEDANMEGSSGAEESDISSEEEDYDEIDSDDVDSDGLEEDFTKMPEQLDEGEVSHQQDFIHF
ncbi:MAG: hypothetical protein M1819_004617 [Sarea resinae]|nr:MAG: hypothetical protein M1819_004617 [Sarea resinae]